DADIATRTGAARGLLAIRGDAARAQVNSILLNDISVYARTGVMSALGHLKTRQSWQSFFEQRLNPERPLLERMTAAEVMGERGEPGSAELLREGVADTSGLFASACASALAEMKDRASVPLLASAYAAHVDDPNPDARIAIRDALRDLASPGFADSLER